MRKNSKFLLFSVCLILLCFAFFGNFVVTQVLATEDNGGNINKTTTILAQDNLSDRYAVKDGAELPTDENNLGGIITNVDDSVLKEMLLNIYKDYDPRYNSPYLQMNMFKDFTKLDLSNLVQGTSNVISLVGIKSLNFESLEELNLSGNNIEEFDVTFFPDVKTKTNEDGTVSITAGANSPVKNIKTLDISNNNLSGTLDLVGEKATEPYFRKLTNLNIANNEFESVLFNVYQEEACLLDYRNNNISDYKKITLPEYGQTTLIMVGNPLVSAETKSNIQLEIGLLNLTDNLDSSSLIEQKEFKTLNITIKIYKKEKIEDSEDFKFTEVNYNPTNMKNFTFKLIPDNYKVEYTDNDLEEVIISKEFTVRPKQATYNFEVKKKLQGENKLYTDKITGKGYIHFSVESENAKIYFMYNNDGNWIEGNKCDLTKRNGQYLISYKTVENGIESEVWAIPVQVSYSKFIPDIGLVIIIILVLIFLALVAVPFLKKFLDRISKPN